MAMEKSVFSTVPRCSGPSEARLRRSSVLPRAADRCLSKRIIKLAHSDLSDSVRWQSQGPHGSTLIFDLSSEAEVNAVKSRRALATLTSLFAVVTRESNP